MTVPSRSLFGLAQPLRIPAHRHCAGHAAEEDHQHNDLGAGIVSDEQVMHDLLRIAGEGMANGVAGAPGKKRTLLHVAIAGWPRDLMSARDERVPSGADTECTFDRCRPARLAESPSAAAERSRSAGLQVMVNCIRSMLLQTRSGGWHTCCLTSGQSDPSQLVGSATSPLTHSEEVCRIARALP